MTTVLPARLLSFLVALTALLPAAVAAAPDDAAADAEWRFADVARVVAISDVHGAYPAMLRTLQRAGLVDDALAWQGGTAHLVVTGDLLDRGPESRKAMDLLMRLEADAAAAGGRVHVLLGNHEVMNLVGDLRYVSPQEYAAFAADESPKERERWYAAAVARSPGLTREAFDEAAPAGFFAHRRAFAPDGQYGSWLLAKPLTIVIGETAFVHGGLSPLVAAEGLQGINGGMRSRLGEYVGALQAVTDAGYLLPTDPFYEHVERLSAAPPAGGAPAPPAEAIDTLKRLNAADIHEQDSPLWYRGTVGCSPLLEGARLDAALRKLGAARVVIGHTPTPGRVVLERMNGRVYEIDTGMLTDYYGGSGHALVIENGGVSVIGESTEETSAVAEHPRRVDALTEDAAAADLESILETGEIVASGREGKRTLVTIRHGDGEIRAEFIPNPRTRGVVPDLAAYRLDRLLDLGMVPATVPREIEGEKGVLQFVPPAMVDERQRAESGEGGSAWCPLPLQWQAMYVFDALIFNPARVPERINYTRPDWQLVLSGHDNAFDPRNERPAYLRETALAVDGAWVEALNAIDNDVLRAELDGVLDKRRLLALYQRRDGLLRDVGAAPGREQ